MRNFSLEKNSRKNFFEQKNPPIFLSKETQRSSHKTRFSQKMREENFFDLPENKSLWYLRDFQEEGKAKIKI